MMDQALRLDLTAEVLTLRGRELKLNGLGDSCFGIGHHVSCDGYAPNRAKLGYRNDDRHYLTALTREK